MQCLKGIAFESNSNFDLIPECRQSQLNAVQPGFDQLIYPLKLMSISVIMSLAGTMGLQS